MIYLQLFWVFFKIGLFGFGGGAAMLSLIQFEVVKNHPWMTSSEFADIVAISQITPGPIGINCATYTGYIASHNIFGAAVATSALVLPAFIIMLAIAMAIEKFRNNPWVDSVMRVLRPVVIGLIAGAMLLMITPETFGANYADYTAWIIFIASFALMQFAKLDPILMLVVAAVAGLIIY